MLIFLQDENGVVLGGKKAAIQFAYNLRKQQDGGMDAQIDPNVNDNQKLVPHYSFVYFYKE